MKKSKKSSLKSHSPIESYTTVETAKTEPIEKEDSPNSLTLSTPSINSNTEMTPEQKFESELSKCPVSEQNIIKRIRNRLDGFI